KRGTTVPVEAVFADAEAAAQVEKLRFGIKLAGRYDDLLVVAAETAERVANDDGTVSFHLKLTLDAAVIDTALGVNGNSADDIENANFISEIEWENAAGELTATETVSTVIQNNVVRGSTETSGAAAGTWTALMVIRMSWAEFSVLEQRNPDAIYVVPDAPDPVEEHNANPDAHAETLAALSDNLTAAFDQKRENMQAEIDGNTDALRALSQRVSTSEETLAQIPTQLPQASDSVSGTVKTGGNGVGTTNNVLNLNLRTNHSGLAFENRALYVRAGTDVHPPAGAVLPVGTDSAGKLCVPALPAASPRFTAPILNGAMLVNESFLAIPGKVLCPEITDQGSIVGYFGTLEALGVPAGVDVFPTEITLYRRGGTSSNGNNAMILRVLRIERGAWRVAFESVNTVRANDYSENEAMTWTLANTDGMGPIPSYEQIAIVQVGSNTLAAHATSTFGCKMSGSTGTPLPGAITENLTEDATALPETHATHRPSIDISYLTAVPLRETLSWILSELEDLRGAQGNE
ncbi:MAG: hypothetical protein J6L64_07965, partial [Opitutales bacterium]|nr:hypothetical protein [Opitutales bacterium]